MASRGSKHRHAIKDHPVFDADDIGRSAKRYQHLRYNFPFQCWAANVESTICGLHATKQCTLSPTVDGRKCISINRPFDGTIEWWGEKKSLYRSRWNKGSGERFFFFLFFFLRARKVDGEKRVKLWIKGKRRIRARGGGSNGETSVIMVTALSPFKFTRKKHVELFSFFFFPPSFLF